LEEGGEKGNRKESGDAVCKNNEGPRLEF